MIVLIVERINNANQYIELLASAYQKEGHQVILDPQNFLFSSIVPDMVHIQWPEAIYKWRYTLERSDDSLSRLMSRIDFYKNSGSKIVSTFHNKLPHGYQDGFDYVFYKLIYTNSDIVIHHGANSIQVYHELFGEFDLGSLHLVVPHGPYPVKLQPTKNGKKNYSLPGNKKIFLNFGRQRANKGKFFAQQVFQACHKDVLLWTIGPHPAKNGFSRIINLIASQIRRFKYFRILINRSRNRNCITDDRFVDQREISDIFHACDAVFLGHSNTLNSGVLVQAICHGKPVVCPDIGNLREQAQGFNWIAFYTENDIESAKSALDKVVGWIEDKENLAIGENREWLANNGWDKQVNAIIRCVGQLPN